MRNDEVDTQVETADRKAHEDAGNRVQRGVQIQRPAVEAEEEKNAHADGDRRVRRSEGLQVFFFCGRNFFINFCYCFSRMEELLQRKKLRMARAVFASVEGTQVTCFTSATVPILTPELGCSEAADGTKSLLHE